MKLIETFDPLLDCGDLARGSYELRGDQNNLEVAMVYAYSKINGIWREASTQKGSLSASAVAELLIAELHGKVTK